MTRKATLNEGDLAATAKVFRRQAATTRAQAARDLGVSQTSIFHAEESPGLGLTKLRIRMIEMYSTYKVRGPVYLLLETKRKVEPLDSKITLIFSKP